MTITNQKLADLYELPKKFNTDELVRKEVNKLIEWRQFRYQVLQKTL